MTNQLKFVNIMYMGQVFSVEARCKFVAHNKDLTVVGFAEQPIALKVKQAWKAREKTYTRRVGQLLRSHADWTGSVRLLEECILAKESK